MRALSITLAAFVVLGTQQPSGARLSLTAARLLDVGRGEILRDGIVIIEKDRIVAVGTRASIPAQGTVTDLGDVTLLPGLIDAHVHLTLGGGAEANARATLLAGFTTVQDLGALGYANLRLRDSINSGNAIGPRVIAAGPWLGESGLTCDFQGIGVKGADAFRERVRQDIAAGADVIKVCASGWLPQAVKQADAYEISDDEFRAAIEEAHRARRRVAVHAISQRAIGAAVSFGADLLVHGGFTAPDAVKAMKSGGTYQLPTLWSFKRGNPPALYEQLRAHLETAARAGLPIAFGTDAGVIPHGSNANEFLELEAMGLSKAEAVRAATVHAAKAVGLPSQIGALEAGRFADVIAVRGNPLEDLRALQHVAFVMKGGVTSATQPPAVR